MQALNIVYISSYKDDVRVWCLTTSSLFSIKSCFSILVDDVSLCKSIPDTENLEDLRTSVGVSFFLAGFI